MTATRVLGYVRVSTDEQAGSGLGLGAQRAVIREACASRGWDLVTVLEDSAASGKSLKGRPSLEAAILALDAGEADALVVSKLDRLSRSLLDFAALMERSHKKGWALVALDLGVDTTTPAGEAMANVMATFAQFERRLIGQRTKDALAVKKAAGIKLGRPRTLPTDVVKRIESARAAGATLTAIADELNGDGVATAQGGRQWHPSTVRAILLQNNPC